MIIGIGHDLVDISRIQRIHQRYVQFKDRILTHEEREYLSNHDIPNLSLRYVEFLAGRFATKEAFSKAVGYGIGLAFSFHDLSVLPDTSGAPQCCFSERWTLKLEQIHNACVHLSISHTHNMAQAFVIIEGSNNHKDQKI